MQRISIVRATVTAAAACAVLAGLAGCAAPDASARLAQAFALEDVSTTESVEEGLLAKLPVGTPQADLDAFIERSGVGRDGWSERRGPGGPGVDDDAILCRFEVVQESIQTVKESWGIWFRLDERGTLRTIEARRWYQEP